MQSIVKINDVAIQTNKELNSADEIAFGIFARLASKYLKETEDNKAFIMKGINDLCVSMISNIFINPEYLLNFLKGLGKDESI